MGIECKMKKGYLELWFEISINTDILVLRFYGHIGNIGEILVDILTKISVR